MGIAFGGGGSQTVFGSSGAGNFLTRLTAITRGHLHGDVAGPGLLSSQQDSKRLQRLAEQKAVDEEGRRRHKTIKLKAELEKAGRGRRRRRPRRPSGHGAPAAPATDSTPATAPADAAEPRPSAKGDAKDADGHEGHGSGGRSRAERPRRRQAEGARRGHARGRRPPAAPRTGSAAAGRVDSQRWRCRSPSFRGWATTSSSSTCAPDDRPRRPAAVATGSGGGARRCATATSASAATACWPSCPATGPTRACASSTPTAARPRCAATASAASPRCSTRPTRRCAGRSCASTPAPALLACALERQGRRASTRVAVDMGRPRLTRERDPAGRPGGPERALREPIASRDRDASASPAVSMGNPHAVIFVDEPGADLRALAESLRPGAGDRADRFPQRTNVEFARVRARPRNGDRPGGLGARLRHHPGVRHRRLRHRGRRLPGGAARPRRRDPRAPAGWHARHHGRQDYSGVVMRGPARIVFHGSY